MEKYAFQALGFAFVFLGVIFFITSIWVGVSDTELTLIIAGIVLLAVVEIESRRGSRGAS